MTTEETYQRLTSEFDQLRRIPPSQRTAADITRYDTVRDKLIALLSIPPHGYTLPAAADELIAHAHIHGWDAYAQWTPPGWHGEPSVTVHVGRQLTPAERETEYLGTGEVWHYTLTWHSRGCPPGRVRRRPSLAVTPGHPQPHTSPSVKAVRAVITAHPAPQQDAARYPAPGN